MYNSPFIYICRPSSLSARQPSYVGILWCGKYLLQLLFMKVHHLYLPAQYVQCPTFYLLDYLGLCVGILRTLTCSIWTRVLWIQCNYLFFSPQLIDNEMLFNILFIIRLGPICNIILYLLGTESKILAVPVLYFSLAVQSLVLPFPSICCHCHLQLQCINYSYIHFTLFCQNDCFTNIIMISLDIDMLACYSSIAHHHLSLSKAESFLTNFTIYTVIHSLFSSLTFTVHNYTSLFFLLMYSFLVFHITYFTVLFYGTSNCMLDISIVYLVT